MGTAGAPSWDQRDTQLPPQSGSSPAQGYRAQPLKKGGSSAFTPSTGAPWEGGGAGRADHRVGTPRRSESTGPRPECALAQPWHAQAARVRKLLRLCSGLNHWLGWPFGLQTPGRRAEGTCRGLCGPCWDHHTISVSLAFRVFGLQPFQGEKPLSACTTHAWPGSVPGCNPPPLLPQRTHS